MQNHVTRGAIPPSASRGGGNTDVAEAARNYLRELDLRPFGITDAAHFMPAVGHHYADPAFAISDGAKGRWRLARKLLNIFLRDALYNRYPSDANRLFEAEELFELPLDSYT